MTKSSNSDWQNLLHDLMLETDLAKLREKVDAIENTIFVRAQELENSTDGVAEREAIQKASELLFKVKVEKLGFPINSSVLGRRGSNSGRAEE